MCSILCHQTAYNGSLQNIPVSMMGHEYQCRQTTDSIYWGTIRLGAFTPYTILGYVCKATYFIRMNWIKLFRVRVPLLNSWIGLETQTKIRTHGLNHIAELQHIYSILSRTFAKIHFIHSNFLFTNCKCCAIYLPDLSHAIQSWHTRQILNSR